MPVEQERVASLWRARYGTPYRNTFRYIDQLPTDLHAFPSFQSETPGLQNIGNYVNQLNNDELPPHRQPPAPHPFASPDGSNCGNAELYITRPYKHPHHTAAKAELPPLRWEDDWIDSEREEDDFLLHESAEPHKWRERRESRYFWDFLNTPRESVGREFQQAEPSEATTSSEDIETPPVREVLEKIIKFEYLPSIYRNPPPRPRPFALPSQQFVSPSGLLPFAAEVEMICSCRPLKFEMRRWLGGTVTPDTVPVTPPVERLMSFFDQPVSPPPGMKKLFHELYPDPQMEVVEQLRADILARDYGIQKAGALELQLPEKREAIKVAGGRYSLR